MIHKFHLHTGCEIQEKVWKHYLQSNLNTYILKCYYYLKFSISSIIYLKTSGIMA
jgi:hypothetical protein